MATATPDGRTALVAGASGLVGREILQGLLADDSVAAVHSVGRRELPLAHPKLTQHRVDFKAPLTLPRVDEAFIALGTTIKVAGSQEAFRAIDFDAARLAAPARAHRRLPLGRTQRAEREPARHRHGIRAVEQRL